MRGVSSLITSLPTFMGSFSFFGDELHMIGHGLGHMISNLIDFRNCKRFMKKGLREYTFDVSSRYSQKNFAEQLD